MVVVSQIADHTRRRARRPLPQELQSYITFAGAVGTQSKAPDAARALIKFLKGTGGAAGDEEAWSRDKTVDRRKRSGMRRLTRIPLRSMWAT
jgi:hypothetical protein